MNCKHERIKSENCVISCLDCGAILPADVLMAPDAQKPAKKASDDQGTGKTTSTKRRGRIAEKQP